jgi:hypothetical protein
MANVYTSVSSVTWFTDKCRISTGNAAVTFQILKGAGNLYSAPPSIPANWVQDIYVGVGNQLTITGANFTAQEVGTASSGTAGVN